MAKNTVYQVIIGLLLVGLLFAGVLIFLAYQRPISTPLTINTEPASLHSSASSNVVAQSTAVPAESKDLAQNGKGVMNILIIASDDNWWVYPQGADAIRMARVDFDENNIEVFAIPRDLLLETPSYKNLGFERMRIGPLYYKVLEAEENKNEDAYSKAVNSIAQTLYDNFEITPDYYIDIRGTSQLPEIIDALGGIEVDIPAAFSDPSISLDLKAGKQQIDGRTALLYMRPLDNPEEEWDRINRQNAVLKGIFAKISDPSVLQKVPEIYSNSKSTIATDLSVDQIVSLAKIGASISFDDIVLDGIKKTDVSIESQGVMTLLDSESVKSELMDIFAK